MLVPYLNIYFSPCTVLSNIKKFKKILGLTLYTEKNGYSITEQSFYIFNWKI